MLYRSLRAASESTRKKSFCSFVVLVNFPVLSHTSIYGVGHAVHPLHIRHNGLLIHTMPRGNPTVYPKGISQVGLNGISEKENMTSKCEILEESQSGIEVDHV